MTRYLLVARQLDSPDFKEIRYLRTITAFHSPDFKKDSLSCDGQTA
jgi:hypothetical protein